jgi:hypothetical protein
MVTRPVLSTYKILKEKACNADIDESWADWAIEMMEAGYESESLYELAGISKPYNQFVLQDLTDRVLKDLQLDYSDKSKTLRRYAYYIFSSNIDKPERYSEVLKELVDFYYNHSDKEYNHFAILYWAKNDLEYGEMQWYWEGANRSNIDKIIREQFELYICKFDGNK